MKGKKGCDSRHIDDGALYQAFIGAYNAMVENKGCFIGKWRERLGSETALVRYKAKQFIQIISKAGQIDRFDINLYFAMVEKKTVYDGGKIIVSLFDGTDIEIEKE